MREVFEVLSLAAGRLAVKLVPGLGGSISAMRMDGIDVMRPLSDADLRAANVLGVASVRGERVFRHIMFYADPTSSAFCVEPQTNASGAFNRPGGLFDPEDNLIVLEPGQGMSGLLRFEPFRL